MVSGQVTTMLYWQNSGTELIEFRLGRCPPVANGLWMTAFSIDQMLISTWRMTFHGRFCSFLSQIQRFVISRSVVRAHSRSSVELLHRARGTISRAPQFQWRLPRNALEVDVRREHQEFVPDAKLRVERVDGSYLHSIAPTCIPQFGRGNMIFPIRYDQGERGEAIHDGFPGLRAREALKQLL